MNPAERDQLIDALLDGAISEADFIRLEAEMLVDPAARQSYYQRLKLDTALRADAGAASDSPKVHAFPTRPFRWQPLAAAAALIAAAIVGWFAGHRPTNAPVAAATETVASGFGVLADEVDAVWSEGQSPIGRGDLVPAGALQLASGIAQIELFSGVTVVVEGDAEFELLSSMEMQVGRGKVRAHVPEQATGFRIRTANGDLVDLGTEFSLDVTSDHADLHVLDGEVEWYPSSATEMRHLTGGEAIRWATDGETTALELESQSIGDIAESLAARRDRRHEAWLAYVDGLVADPRLVAYFAMDEPRTLRDRSPLGHSGTVIRARRTADRWESPDGALDFSPTGSRARVVVPEELHSLTFACWARIDSLDRHWNSLFLTDGHELNEPHWQIMTDGRLFFSVKKRNTGGGDHTDKHIFYSPPVWNQAMSGQWMHIATTFDAEAEKVTHYIDGQAISEEKVPDGYLVDRVRIGAASIGNWSEPKRHDPAFAIRNLNGAIDDFTIFSAALSAAEISELFSAGNP